MKDNVNEPKVCLNVHNIALQYMKVVKELYSLKLFSTYHPFCFVLEVNLLRVGCYFISWQEVNTSRVNRD